MSDKKSATDPMNGNGRWRAVQSIIQARHKVEPLSVSTGLRPETVQEKLLRELLRDRTR